jgi:sec-independent protein translocase protein TatA
MTSSLLAFISMPGPMELLIILAIMLLLFGNRLPTVMRSLGVSAREFKKGVQGMEDEFHEASKPVASKDEKHD